MLDRLIDISNWRPSNLRFSWVLYPMLFLATIIQQATAPSQQMHRQDFHIQGEPGIQLFVREVVAQNSRSSQPILLIHGARVPGVASFDLDVPDGSLAADLAGQGFAVYVMDVRGYGSSTRPKEMDEPASAHPPLVRSNEAVRDTAAVVDWITRRQKTKKVALLGWATGGQWAGYYASLYPEKLSALIMLNSLYSGSTAHPMLGHGSDMEDPAHPGVFNQASCGAYRLNTRSSLFGVWDRSIPDEDKDRWRDAAIAKAYADAALASDPSSASRTPPSFRSPCGALEDSFYLAIGRQLYDASLITAPTLVIASEQDFWSRPADREMLREHLVHSSRVKIVVIPGATHFVHLDRPEHGLTRLLNEITGFMRDIAGK